MHVSAFEVPWETLHTTVSEFNSAMPIEEARRTASVMQMYCLDDILVLNDSASQSTRHTQLEW